MSRTLRRLLFGLAIVSLGSVVSLSPHFTGPAFAQSRPEGPPPGQIQGQGRPAGPPPGLVRQGRAVPAPLLGVGWPAIALAGAALVGYRLHQRKRSNRADEGAAESPPEGN
jgi:hypothetical protein